MPLSAGTRVGPYEILSALGAGGMGEVYRARDEKLQREVALKLLPENMRADPDRLARFEREARILATLNHPNICGIYGVEEADGIRFLVLELVAGPKLAAQASEGGRAPPPSRAPGVARPGVGRDLDATCSSLRGCRNGYLLALGSRTLLGGSLGARHGGRRVFVLGTVIWPLMIAAL